MADPHLLDDCWLLIARAEKQFDALRAEIVEFLKDHSAELVIEDDPDSGEKCVYFTQEPVVPRAWGADVGQLVSNARTALDHLVYALAIEGGGQPDADKTAFPVFEKRDEYFKVRGRGARKSTVRDQYLAGVEEQWREKIDAVQPYRHTKNAWRDPLAVLSEIANSHKHKTLKAARVAIETPGYICFSTSDNFGAVAVSFDPRSPEDVSAKAQVKGTRKTLVRTSIVLHRKMKVDERVGVGVMFGMPPRPYSLDDIKGAVAWARSIIKWLEPAFDPGV